MPVPSKEDPFRQFVEIIIIWFSVQHLMRYPSLIKKILRYTEPDQDRELTERALRTAERILNTISEAIREQEGRDQLKTLAGSVDWSRVRADESRIEYRRTYLRFLQGSWI